MVEMCEVVNFIRGPLALACQRASRMAASAEYRKYCQRRFPLSFNTMQYFPSAHSRFSSRRSVASASPRLLAMARTLGCLRPSGMFQDFGSTPILVDKEVFVAVVEVVGGRGVGGKENQRARGDGFRWVPDIGVEEGVIKETLKRFCASLHRAHGDAAAKAVVDVDTGGIIANTSICEINHGKR